VGSTVSLTEAVLEFPLIYRLWQAPFVNQKLRPLLAHNDLGQVRRVLDVGCGPGTNAPLFQRKQYLGLDFNPKYIANARRRFRGDFVVADVTTYEVAPGERFDFILVNSMLHHIDTPGTDRILAHLKRLLTPDGHVHLLELVQPVQSGIPHLLTSRDRGKFPRPQEKWRTLFRRHFEEVVFEPYRLTAFGVTLWHMIYFKGRARS
jgi:SAM-dependent methyltransferase